MKLLESNKNLRIIRSFGYLVLFAGAATILLVTSHAATPAASVEAENGTLAGSATSVADAGASGGLAVQFGSAVGTGLPAGVTLQDIDGGANYYAQWSNSFSTDPTFYPLATFDQSVGYDPASGTFDKPQIDKYAAIGINGIVGLYNGSNSALISYLASKGIWNIDSPLAPASAGKNQPAYVWFDEADGNNRCADIPSMVTGVSCTPTADGRTPPAAIASVTQKLHQLDSTRPVYGQYTKPVGLGEGISDAQATAYINAVDIVSFDWYTISDGWETNNDLWRQYDAVLRIRQLGGYTKPVMPFIEAPQPFEASSFSGVTPTPAMIVAETWNAIIAGARGIQYFDHDFCAGCGGYAVSANALVDSNAVFKPMQTAIGTLNARIKALAPVINAKFANGYETHTGSMNVMTKYYNGSFYVFAAPRFNTSTNITFNLAGAPSGTVTVLDEGRTIPLSGGTFTDNFANQTAVHIYKIN